MPPGGDEPSKNTTARKTMKVSSITKTPALPPPFPCHMVHPLSANTTNQDSSGGTSNPNSNRTYADFYDPDDSDEEGVEKNRHKCGLGAFDSEEYDSLISDHYPDFLEDRGATATVKLLQWDVMVRTGNKRGLYLWRQGRVHSLAIVLADDEETGRKGLS